MMWVRLLSFSVSILGTCAWSTPLSLQEAIDRALKDSPVLAAEKQRETIADLEMKNRANAFYPKLDLESSHGVGTTNVAQSNDPWVSSAQLKLTEKIYDNGSSWTKYKQGKDDREVARLQYDRVRDELILQITEKYYGYSKAHLVLEAVNTQKEMIEKQWAGVLGW